MTKIDWTKWSAIAEILSAVAIVVTLLYLAIQTQYLAVQTEQNNRFMAAQAGYNMLLNRTWYREALFLDPDLADFWVRVTNADPSDLSEADLLRIQMQVRRQILGQQWEFRQFADGNLAQEQLHFTLPGGGPYREQWEFMKSELDRDFVEWMETGEIAEIN